MDKKTQITLFIIIGIVIIACVGIIFYMNNILKEKPGRELDTGSDIRESVVNYIESCILETAEPLIFELAEKGGTFRPDSGIIEDSAEINTLMEYDISFGYRNNYLTREKIRTELSNKIQAELHNCIDLGVFRKQGLELKTGQNSVKTVITDSDVKILLTYPITIQRDTETIKFNEFSSELAIPLGTLHSAAIDIINSEASFGYFDKEDYMQKRPIRIEKHRPYPNTIYTLRMYAPKYQKDLVFQFAITGKDTAGKEVIRFGSSGCCAGEMCFKNVVEEECQGPDKYNDNIDCNCPNNLQPMVDGCCNEGDSCRLTRASDCSGRFYEKDFLCAQAECSNLDCMNTYDYVDDNFTGNPRPHGSSWCSYESMVGKGLDYVGTRHYLHSCIDGVEYVEECRDFREELCTEKSIKSSGKYFAKAQCRLNRWYDCSEQEDQASCEDPSKRDCVWADYLRSQTKCHPEVPPGLKFWEYEGNDICYTANQYKDSFGRKYPRTWGYSTFLYCQRTGDCGNYRNIADEITRLGYYNRDGEAKDWVYWDDGYIKKGNKYVIRADLNQLDVERSARIPIGSSGGDAVCSLWQAPNTNKCDLCTNSSIHPCTEYRCKSLGSNCVFKESDKSCKITGRSDTKGPSIIINDIGAGYHHETQSSTNYPDSMVYVVSPMVPIHEPLRISFSTSEPTRCKLSLYPPNIARDYIDLPEILLNTFDYKEEYSAEIRFPSSNLTSLSSYLIFIKCTDQAGNPEKTGEIIRISTTEQLNDTKKPVIINISADPSPVVRGMPNKIGIFVNEPFDDCRYAYSDNEFDNMTTLSCITEEYEIMYDVRYPLGSFICTSNLDVPEDSTALYIACKDKAENINDNFEFSLV